MLMTWRDMGLLLAVIVVVTLTAGHIENIAGFISARWDVCKRDKTKGGEL